MSRILAIDTCRGIMLILMTINHLFVLPLYSINYLAFYLYQPIGLFSDAEGFFFLSGLLSGMIYGKRLLQGKYNDALAHIWRRIKKLYVWNMLMMLGLAGAVACIPRYLDNWLLFHDGRQKFFVDHGMQYFLAHPFKATFLSGVFLHQIPFLNILPIYTIFLVATAFLLRMLARGQFGRIASISFGVWTAAQWIPEYALEKFLRMYLPVDLGWFNPLTWQVYFIAGLVIGCMHIQKKFPPPLKLLTALACVLVLFFLWLKYHQPVDLIGASYHFVGPIRMLSFASAAYVVYSFNNYFSHRFLALLGTYSLEVFCWHVIVCFALIMFLPEIDALSLWAKIGIIAATVASLWPVAYAADWYKKRTQPPSTL